MNLIIDQTVDKVIKDKNVLIDHNRSYRRFHNIRHVNVTLMKHSLLLRSFCVKVHTIVHEILFNASTSCLQNKNYYT